MDGLRSRLPRAARRLAPLASATNLQADAAAPPWLGRILHRGARARSPDRCTLCAFVRGTQSNGNNEIQWTHNLGRGAHATPSFAGAEGLAHPADRQTEATRTTIYNETAMLECTLATRHGSRSRLPGAARRLAPLASATNLQANAAANPAKASRSGPRIGARSARWPGERGGKNNDQQQTCNGAMAPLTASPCRHRPRWSGR
jgi:hypothetical protein